MWQIEMEEPRWGKYVHPYLASLMLLVPIRDSSVASIKRKWHIALEQMLESTVRFEYLCNSLPESMIAQWFD